MFCQTDIVSSDGNNYGYVGNGWCTKADGNSPVFWHSGYGLSPENKKNLQQIVNKGSQMLRSSSFPRDSAAMRCTPPQGSGSDDGFGFDCEDDSFWDDPGSPAFNGSQAPPIKFQQGIYRI